MNSKVEEKKYVPVVVSQGISQHMDTIFHINELNLVWHGLTPRMHYDYLFYSVRKMRRSYSKWAKKAQTDALLEAVCQYYGVNRRVGKSYIPLLTKEQCDLILETRIEE